MTTRESLAREIQQAVRSRWPRSWCPLFPTTEEGLLVLCPGQERTVTLVVVVVAPGRSESALQASVRQAVIRAGGHAIVARSVDRVLEEMTWLGAVP